MLTKIEQIHSKENFNSLKSLYTSLLNNNSWLVGFLGGDVDININIT